MKVDPHRRKQSSQKFSREHRINEAESGRHNKRADIPRLLRTLLAGFLILWGLLPPFARSRALLILNLYDIAETNISRLKSLGTEVRIPYKTPVAIGEKNYYFLPVMNTYEASRGLSAKLGRDIGFIIDYAVADYEIGPAGIRRGYSAFYEANHPLYSSYIGSYYLSGNNFPMDEVVAMSALEYDLRSLALPAIGLIAPKSTFKVEKTQETNHVEISGLTWTEYDAEINTNGPEHQPTGFQTGYLQFGLPPLELWKGPQYPKIKMYGRIYIIWLPEKNLSLGLYALASTHEALDALAETYLKQAVVSFR